MLSRPQQLLQKYFARRCSRAELEELLDYLEKHPEEEAHEHTIRSLWQELHGTELLSSQQSDDLYQRISVRPSRYPTAAVWKVAASLVGVLLGILLTYYLWISSETTQSAGFGETRSVVLPDASTVVLNGNSSVRYARRWSPDAPRQVWLMGEAYFSVQHLANEQPFTVYLDNMAVEVLGTEFNVQSRRGTTRVTLDAGRVKLNVLGDAPVANNNVILRPGEQATLNQDQRLTLSSIETPPVSAWRNHELVFNETPLETVAQTIEDLYGRPVIIEGDRLRQLKLTGTLPNNDIKTLLALLREIFSIRATEEGEQIYFRE